MKVLAVVLLSSLAAVSACASRSRTRCETATTDFMHDGMPVYYGCAVDRPAQTRVSVRPTFDVNLAQQCHTVELEFVIDTTGKPVPQTVRVIRSNSSGLLEAVMSNLTTLRYTAAQKGGQSVQQLHRSKHEVAIRRASGGGGAPPPCA